MRESLRVLQVGKFYEPHAGGIESVVRSLSEGLVGAGERVSVLCYSDGISPAPTWERRGGVRVIRAPVATTRLSQPISPSLLGILARITQARGGAGKDRFDLIHFHSPNPLVEAAWLALRKDRVPYLTTYHADVTRQRLTRGFYHPFLREFLAGASRIVVATRQHVRHSPVLAAFEEKCAVIPFALDRDLETRIVGPGGPDPALLARARELQRSHGRFVLFVGRLVRYKGVEYLLRAMSGMPDAQVVIVGEGPEEAALRAEAARVGLGERAHFTGRLGSREELLAHYLAAELLALPSINASEAFGMVLLEAFACGKPVVTTRIPSGVRFVNEEGVTGLAAEPADAASLARAIRALLDDPGLRQRLGSAALARYHELFTQDRMIRSHRELYRSILERSPEVPE